MVLKLGVSNAGQEAGKFLPSVGAILAAPASRKQPAGSGTSHAGGHGRRKSARDATCAVGLVAAKEFVRPVASQQHRNGLAGHAAETI